MARRWGAVAALGLVAALLAVLRPVNHDESQYVAAAVLAARGLLPYRDFAYLQTPLQPLLFAPVAWAAGVWTWPTLRLLNAGLGLVAALAVRRAAREGGAGPGVATAAAALLLSCDVLLFAMGTARNDALPAALLALALPGIVRAERGRGSPRDALVVGLLLAAATAAKISYALPALAYGLWSLADRRHHPLRLLLGALPPALLVAWTFGLSPEGFRFGVFDFPHRAPAEYFADRPSKLSLVVKAVDVTKFLALGAAFPALAYALRRRGGVLAALTLAGLVAAAGPTPTWRQYLLPALPPLFAMLALAFHERPPERGWRTAFALFAAAGLAPSALSLARDRFAIPDAMRESVAIAHALDAAGVQGHVATLAPQFLPATGRTPLPESAAGPFYFRSTGLLDEAAERRLRLVSRARPRLDGAAAVLTGGEGRRTAGSDRLDAELARVARDAGWRETPVPGAPWRLFTPPAGSDRPLGSRNTP